MQKRTKLIKEFWQANTERLNLQMEMSIVEQKAKVQKAHGMLKFEQIGQQRLDDAASAVHQRQHSDYVADSPPKQNPLSSVEPSEREIEQDRDIFSEALVDEDILHEAHTCQLLAVQPMTDGDWAKAMDQIESYRQKLAKERRLYDSLYYFIVDHSGQHGPTANMLADYLPAMRLAMPQGMNFHLPVVSEEDETFLSQLLAAKHAGDIPVRTIEDYPIRDLFVSISKAVTMRGKDDISEMEHTMRNIVPYLDATVGRDEECRIHYGEQTLEPTAVRRNAGSDPTKRARAGYKVDIIIEYQELNWLPVVGCGEVSGGLPRCSRAKEWTDTLELGLELRDVWVMAQKELVVANADKLVIWGFTVVGRKLRIYALAAVRKLFHLVLAEEISLPSSRRDFVNTKHAYLATLGFNEKVQETKRMIDALNQNRVAAIRKRDRTPEQETRPEIIETPTFADIALPAKHAKKARRL
ncbi:hypothetical protein BC936DRAFT_148060 [Jimgerdemannia flammicorona]|uniref:Uncharacterized protein n=1 Tax=Jimgerdemannia flammicorona TaxID=994334 RepID=A0A433D414_9FUNG|nr:hypothetical protein BC936DRAFT_148060 [Jimgerdemannia flammicorona]